MTQRPVSLTARYRVFGVTAQPVGRDAVFLQSTRTGRSCVLPPADAGLLLSCKRPDTLAGHAQQHLKRRNQNQPRTTEPYIIRPPKSLLRLLRIPINQTFTRREQQNDIERKLTVWAADGLLISERELRQDLERLAHAAECPISKGQTTITAVGIPTCDRPLALARCLNSFLGNFEHYGRNPNVVVVDDSRDPGRSDHNAATFRQAVQSYSGTLYSMNRMQRIAFARWLSRVAGCAPSILEFGLMGHPACGRSEGACRNAILLLTKGHMVLQTDDDTICRIAQPPTVHDGLTLTSKVSSDAYWFFRSHEEAIHAASRLNTDLLALHEGIIGKRVDQLIAQYLADEMHIDVDTLSMRFIDNMTRECARVRLTLPGPVGDTCLYTDFYRLVLEGDSIYRLVESRERFRANLATRQVIRCVTMPTITDFPRCIGMNFAIDNRALLPPFMPVQARCDGIFGDLLAVCFPGAYGASIPYALVHQPPEDRATTVDDLLRRISHVRLNDVIAEVIYDFNRWPRGTEPADNLRSLGALFRSLAGVPASELDRRLREIYGAAMHRQITLAQWRLDSARELPDYWRDELQRATNAMRSSILDTKFAYPVDIRDGKYDGDTANYGVLKDILAKFGDLLINWPEIWDAMDSVGEEERMRHLTVYR